MWHIHLQTLAVHRVLCPVKSLTLIKHQGVRIDQDTADDHLDVLSALDAFTLDYRQKGPWQGHQDNLSYLTLHPGGWKWTGLKDLSVAID